MMRLDEALGVRAETRRKTRGTTKRSSTKERMVKTKRRRSRRERAEDYCLEHAVELGLVRCSEPGCGKVLTLEEARAGASEDEEDDGA